MSKETGSKYLVSQAGQSETWNQLNLCWHSHCRGGSGYTQRWVPGQRFQNSCLGLSCTFRQGSKIYPQQAQPTAVLGYLPWLHPLTAGVRAFSCLNAYLRRKEGTGSPTISFCPSCGLKTTKYISSSLQHTRIGFLPCPLPLVAAPPVLPELL